MAHIVVHRAIVRVNCQSFIMSAEETRNKSGSRIGALESSSIAKKSHRVCVTALLGCLTTTLALTHLLRQQPNGESIAFQLQRRRNLRTVVRTWSSLTAKAFSCQELLDASSTANGRRREPVTGSGPFSRRLTREASSVYNPIHWSEDERSLAYSQNPTLQRVDRILQGAKVYNKDLVIDVTDDAELAGVSLYASAYGWPVLTLQADSLGQVHRMCEATKSATRHHVLPLWAGNFNSVPVLDSDVLTDEKPTVRLDQLAALTTSSSSSRIRLLHINIPRDEWKALMGASRLLSQRRIDHVLVTIHFDQQHQEDEAVRVLETLLRAGYLPVDDKDRKRPLSAAFEDETALASTSHAHATPNTIDATEYLRHLLELHQGASSEVWFY